MATAVVVESRFDPRCDKVEALDVRLVSFAQSGAPLLDAAGRLLAAAFSREVRRVDLVLLEAGGADPTDEEVPEREVLRVRAPRRVRTKWGDVMRTLRRVTGQWLPTETCVELVAAEVISAIDLEVDPAEPTPLARVRSGRADSVDAREPMLPPAAPAPSSTLRRGARSGPRGCGPFELDRRHYAGERPGMSARRVRALLRLERACTLAAVFGDAWREGRITCSQAHPPIPLILARGSEPFHAAGIERATEVTVRRLEDDVEHALATGAFDPALLAGLPELVLPGLVNLDDPLVLPEGVQIGAEPRGREETDVWVANVPADAARLFRACLCSVARCPNT